MPKNTFLNDLSEEFGFFKVVDISLSEPKPEDFQGLPNFKRPFVKTYQGHVVPDDATSVSKFPVNDKGNLEFFRTKNGTFQYMDMTSDCEPVWQNAPFNVLNKWAIDLPFWEPEIGKECQVAHGGDWLNCLFIGKGLDDHYIYQLTEQYRFELNGDPEISNFRPAKTAEELLRDSFFTAVYKELRKIEQDLDCVGDRTRKEDAIANILFKANFKAPE
jgi:hypothetical protein